MARAWRPLAGTVAALATAYYVVGELPINLWLEAWSLHVAWALALAGLWYLVFHPPSRQYTLRSLLVGCMGACVFVLGYVETDRACGRIHAEAERVSFERLGVACSDYGTPRDPWQETCFKAAERESAAVSRLEAASRDREPGWCRAAAILARLRGEEVPERLNCTPDRPLFICGTPADRGFLPFPHLSMSKSRLRYEQELVAAAELLRTRALPGNIVTRPAADDR